MATASGLLSEDQFLCSICLDVFTDPVTIPCGHNFCKTCITNHWDINVRCQCPMCNKRHDRRPELHINTFISEMAAQFRQSVQNKASSSSEQPYVGEVVCDVCTETKEKALKSCLVCMASYCETHLEPHRRITGLKRHTLIDPVENLESRMCKKHDRPLELFCKTDQVCVCEFCTETSHKKHRIVPLKNEYEGKKAKLLKTKAEVDQLIQERQRKIQELKQSVELSKVGADRETAASVQVFTALMQSVERHLAELTDIIKKKHTEIENEAEMFIKMMKEEISELMVRSAELEQLSHTEDHLQLIQVFPLLNTVPPINDWPEVGVHLSYEGTVRRAVAQLKEALSKEVKKLCADIELKRVQQYAVDVTFDPETAHPKFILSDDGKQVSLSDVRQNLPDSPKRFSSRCVLGMQSFSSGRFYYEVQVQEKTAWTLGVARESINRKSKSIILSPLSGYWTVCLSNGNQYEACPAIHLSLKLKPQKVGVFVDYEEGLVSFYDVDAAALIYSFTGCDFTGELYPYFNPGHNYGTNATPLTICSINHTD